MNRKARKKYARALGYYLELSSPPSARQEVLEKYRKQAFEKYQYEQYANDI